MSVLDLIIWPDRRLTQNCAAIETVTNSVRALAQDMLDTLYDAQGRGLAGPQVGVMQRLFVMDTEWKTGEPDPKVFINPLIMVRDPKFSVATEGCLSIPGLELEVRRPAAVTVQWTSETGEIHMDDFDGFAARCIQHEIDHLNGVVTFDHLDDQARAKAIREYTK